MWETRARPGKAKRAFLEPEASTMQHVTTWGFVSGWRVTDHGLAMEQPDLTTNIDVTTSL